MALFLDMLYLACTLVYYLAILLKFNFNILETLREILFWCQIKDKVWNFQKNFEKKNFRQIIAGKKGLEVGLTSGPILGMTASTF